MKISAVIVAYNEEHNIVRCLKSLQFCDEIVVVDSFSEDKTRELAASLSPRIVTHQWEGYVNQKNFAVRLATNEWVLSLDADEEVSEELSKEIQQTLSKECVSCSGFSIPRKTFHSGRWIRYGGWYPNRLVRLFKKSEGEWIGLELHERWQCQGKEGMLYSHLIHHSFNNIADQVTRNNHYSSLGAVGLARLGTRFSLFKLITKPVSKFIETYLLKKGFLDGLPGLLISISAAYSVFLKWAKLWELKHREQA
ncbi:MAG: glycosyltransferase family 2 protein [Deltaproteobacteria bacterium]|nr:glycosyltransferase family 2 protein [Deltaproteobacteria bacterium]